MKKIAIALSGGVDSAVSALLLKKQGYNVHAVHAVCFDENVPYCTSPKDREDAIKIASQLDIPIRIYDLSKEYKNIVIDYFVGEYEKGNTPNPDVLCNRDIKFSILYDKCFKELDIDYFATGHYARLDNDCNLMIPKDKSKDQTYFLWQVDRNKLQKVIFPLCDLLKLEVREIAKSNSLHNSEKKDSQGICFMGNVSVSEFLKDKVKYSKGKVVDMNGRVIGSHDGVPFYTIGQRHGFKIDKYFDKPVYIIEKKLNRNMLIVGEKECLFKHEIGVSGVYPRTNIKMGDRYKVRIRHLGELHDCEIVKITSDNLKINLKKNIYAPAKGQSTVFYKDNRLAFGGIIA